MSHVDGIGELRRKNGVMVGDEQRAGLVHGDAERINEQSLVALQEPSQPRKIQLRIDDALRDAGASALLLDLAAEEPLDQRDLVLVLSDQHLAPHAN